MTGLLKYISFVVCAILIVMNSTQLSAVEIPLYELTVTLSPTDHSLEGRAKITVPEGAEVSIGTGGLIVKAVRLNGKALPTEKDTSFRITKGTGSQILEIDYRAVILGAPVKEDVRNTGVVATNTIDSSGTMLLSGWYPEIESFCTYKLTVELPAEFDAVSESDSVMSRVEKENKILNFEFPHPVSGISLVAGKYRVREENYHGVMIRAYFFPEDAGLSENYIAHTKKYLDLYESMLGKYPYESFSIVENAFQTGYSFPTYTLLGSEVVRLPFILETSLGHEFLHQWFGNSVYVDYGKGNWSEGLTTYLADHWYEHLKGKAAEYRKKMLIDYRNYVSPENEIPLRDFTSRADFASRAVGYGKSAMVFHMLRKNLGDETFFRSMREFVRVNTFKNAAWDDIEKSFETASGKDLRPYFDQWLNRKGIPSLRVDNALAVYRDGAFVVHATVAQNGDVYRIALPARVSGGGDKKDDFMIDVGKPSVYVEKKLPEKPFSVSFDADYDVMRSLSKDEVPPVISGFTGSKKSIVIIPEGGEEDYRNVVQFFRETGYSVKAEKEITDSELGKNSFLILSPDTAIYKRLFAGLLLPQGGFVVSVERNPLNPEKVAIIFKAESREEFAGAYRKLFRYGNYSLLVFDHGESRKKEMAPSESGIQEDLSLSALAVRTRDAFDIDEILPKVKDQKIICIGETHTEYSDHVMQFELMRKLHAENSNLIIGMEMFQRPFQKYLDQYIQGEITEKDFLKKSEYFTRWTFNYNLYRDILNFATAGRIPVIALNQRKEIIEKVSKSGIGSLTRDEYAQIPHDMDMANAQYREFLRRIFAEHESSQNMNFDYFFESQILWDETMAHSVAEALSKFPGARMVVLAGNGHFQNSWGIPDRIKRLTDIRPVIVMNSSGERITRTIADYVLYPQRSKAPEPPLLMVELKETKEGIEVMKVSKGGPADKAGIEASDILKTIDGAKIEGIADIKIALLDKKPGDIVRLTLLRKRFLLGPKEMDVEVTL